MGFSPEQSQKSNWAASLPKYPTSILTHRLHLMVIQEPAITAKSHQCPQSIAARMRGFFNTQHAAVKLPTAFRASLDRGTSVFKQNGAVAAADINF